MVVREGWLINHTPYTRKLTFNTKAEAGTFMRKHLRSRSSAALLVCSAVFQCRHLLRT